MPMFRGYFIELKAHCFLQLLRLIFGTSSYLQSTHRHKHIYVYTETRINVLLSDII